MDVQQKVQAFPTLNVFTQLHSGMKFHFIAIGGSVMHNLALELAALGHSVTGSDDEIRDPAKSRLAAAGLLPETMGWVPERITPQLNGIVLGMHARTDNPELRRAQELGIPIYSFPEFVYSLARNKQRVVVAGSHGKTTVTAMIMHVLKAAKRDFDYLAGAQLEGFDRMVRLSNTAPTIVVEGDEYLASPIDPRPKFRIYKPHVLVLTGIAWDHINVFPTEEMYVAHFAVALQEFAKAGMCVYNREDKTVRDLVHKYLNKEKHFLIPYVPPITRMRDAMMEVRLDGMRINLQVIGAHNAANAAAAWEVCKRMAISPAQFTAAMESFRGAAYRMQKVYEDAESIIIRDFAHAPSKVLATVNAAADAYKGRNLIAVLELHTFSSLNKDYIAGYRNTLKRAKYKVVMVSDHTLRMKQMSPLSTADITTAFHDKSIIVVRNKEELRQSIRPLLKKQNLLLMMSSGDFEGLELTTLLK